MNTPAKPELEQLTDTYRAVTEGDVTEPLLPEMRELTGMIDRKCRTTDEIEATAPCIRAFRTRAVHRHRHPGRSSAHDLLLNRLGFLQPRFPLFASTAACAESV